MVTLREFRFPDDYEEVYGLWETAGPGIRLRRSDTLEEIGKKVERDPDLFLLAVIDSEIVGTVMGGFDGRRGLIYHLVVKAGYREQGLGGKLMDEVERRLKKKGCIKSYLLVTRDNASAMHFYEKRGWQNMDTTVFIYGKDL
jgi:ribosomal protein S18 acetylase RimI-like enzyme